MKCINKGIAAAVCCAVILCAAGCGSDSDVVIESAYDVYGTSAEYGLTNEIVASTLEPFAEDLCVIGFDDTDSSADLHTDVAEGAAVFNTAQGTVSYAQNVYETLYPASTTKILTAYLAIKYGDLTQEVTVSEEALADLDSASSVCGLNAGDTLTLEQLLYGLMLCSGNDAAEVIAEAVSGSREEFIALMNSEAASLGAVNSNFVNPHGLPDEDHYTTVYDLYLIFNAAIAQEEFITLISCDSYEAVYTDAAGSSVTKTWSNTNWYLTGDEETPEGITVIGGKTGTTNAAGYCLVLLSENDEEEPLISIILKADTRSDLYLFMSELLTGFSGD